MNNSTGLVRDVRSDATERQIVIGAAGNEWHKQRMQLECADAVRSYTYTSAADGNKGVDSSPSRRVASRSERVERPRRAARVGLAWPSRRWVMPGSMEMTGQ